MDFVHAAPALCDLLGDRAHRRATARDDNARRPAMQASNPKYVLRNYLAQVAIERTEQGDYSEIEHLLTVLHAPFDDRPQRVRYAEPPPSRAGDIQVRCSS